MESIRTVPTYYRLRAAMNGYGTQEAIDSVMAALPPRSRSNQVVQAAYREISAEISHGTIVAVSPIDRSLQQRNDEEGVTYRPGTHGPFGDPCPIIRDGPPLIPRDRAPPAFTNGMGRVGVFPPAFINAVATATAAATTATTTTVATGLGPRSGDGPLTIPQMFAGGSLGPGIIANRSRVWASPLPPVPPASLLGRRTFSQSEREEEEKEPAVRRFPRLTMHSPVSASFLAPSSPGSSESSTYGISLADVQRLILAERHRSETASRATNDQVSGLRRDLQAAQRGLRDVTARNSELYDEVINLNGMVTQLRVQQRTQRAADQQAFFTACYHQEVDGGLVNAAGSTNRTGGLLICELCRLSTTREDDFPLGDPRRDNFVPDLSEQIPVDAPFFYCPGPRGARQHILCPSCVRGVFRSTGVLQCPFCRRGYGPFLPRPGSTRTPFAYDGGRHR